MDPVDGSAEGFVSSPFVGDIADAQPERDLGMLRDDRPGRLERAVDVAEGPEGYRDDAGRVVAVVVVPGAGTSMSVLSQMKSLLL